MARATRAMRTANADRQRKAAPRVEPQVQPEVEEDELEGQVEETASAPDNRVVAFLKSPYLTLISRLVLGAVFTISGLSKLGTPTLMANSIKAYEMNLPSALVQLMAVGMPVLELAIGIWLLVGLFTRLSAALSMGLMVVFLIAITQAWIRGLNVDCGCFATGQGNGLGAAVMSALGPVGTWLSNEKVGLEAIIRDLVFLLMGVHLLLVPTIFSLDDLRNRGRRDEALEEAEATS